MQGDNIAYIAFPSQTQADRAIAILNGCKLMDKTVHIERVLSLEELQYGMFLANVDPAESDESIRRLCNDAVGKSDAVIHVRVNQRKGINRFLTYFALVIFASGTVLPSRRVYFSNDGDCTKCIHALNRREWKGRTLSAGAAGYGLLRPTLLIKFPFEWTESETTLNIEKILGDTPYKRIEWKQEFMDGNVNTRFAFVVFHIEDDANVALQKFREAYAMSGGKIKARRQEAEKPRRNSDRNL